jgi:uncharacterized protein (TIGR03437 family)
LFGFALAFSCLHATDRPLISVLTIETDNVVTYVADVTDPSKLALMTAPTTPGATRAFTESLTIGDIVSINGRPAKGLWQSRGFAMGYSPTAAAGFAVADSAEGGPGECKWAILSANGVLVGRFQEGGLGTHQITGGSGVFLGIQGTQTTVQTVVAPRRASMTEDPNLRRVLGGGKLVHTFHIAPSYPPTFNEVNGNPAVFHTDFSPVTAANPAHAEEALITQVVNVGFTYPGVDPGAPFPNSGPYQPVIAPLEVLAGGQAQDAFNAIGWPGQVNIYRADFTIPNGTPSGMLAVQLRVAGIVGPGVMIPVQ